jgi:hypothetical protein
MKEKIEKRTKLFSRDCASYHLNRKVTISKFRHRSDGCHGKRALLGMSFSTTNCGRFRRSCGVCHPSTCSFWCEEALAKNPKQIRCLIQKLCRKYDSGQNAKNATLTIIFSGNIKLPKTKPTSMCRYHLWENVCKVWTWSWNMKLSYLRKTDIFINFDNENENLIS